MEGGQSHSYGTDVYIGPMSAFVILLQTGCSTDSVATLRGQTPRFGGSRGFFMKVTSVLVWVKLTIAERGNGGLAHYGR